jgi:protein tyrosine/serine phosphatase
MSRLDIARIKEDIRPRTVIDLRTPRELTKQREISLLDEVGARYHNVPLQPASPDYVKQETERFHDATDLGELYLYRIRQPKFGQGLVDSLELIADCNNHPLVFHCSMGKDRTGVLAAMLLYVEGLRSRRPALWLGLAPLSFACAVLTKEAAATLPAALLLWELLLWALPSSLLPWA